MDEPCRVDDEMRPEYDYSGGVRGKYAERYVRRFGVEIVREGSGFVSLCPELDIASQGDTQSCGFSMEEVAAEFGVTLNMAQRWRSETGRHKPRAGWEAVLAGMAEHGAAANRERADAAVRLAAELRGVANREDDL